MDKNISKQIKDLVADNRLEDALNLLIGIEQNKGRQRYNTLVILKGKLEMLEEQELADLLEFDDLAREKGKIAHALLNMTDDVDAAPQNANPAPVKQVDVQKNIHKSPTAPPIFKYLFFGLLGIAALFFVFKMANNNRPEPPTQEQTETPEEKGQTEKKVEPKAPTADRQKTSTNTSEQPKKVEEQPKQVTEQPRPLPKKEADIRLSGFPNTGTTYSLGDTKFIFKEVYIRRLGKTGKLELACKIEFICRTNFDTCTRPNIRLLADDSTIETATTDRPKNWIGSGNSVEEKMTFVFGDNASNYRIQLEKHGSPWTRGFKILL